MQRGGQFGWLIHRCQRVLGQQALNLRPARLQRLDLGGQICQQRLQHLAQRALLVRFAQDSLDLLERETQALQAPDAQQAQQGARIIQSIISP